MIRIISKLLTWIHTVLLREYPVWLFIGVSAVIAFIISFVGCTDSNPQEMRTKVIVGSVEYHGHQYLVFRSMDGKEVDVEHDTDCPCWKIDD